MLHHDNLEMRERNLQHQEKAFLWIREYTLNGAGGGKGIAMTSKQRVIYPEVTGYYIPTLIRWNEIELAKAYARHLVTIQKEDGSWCDPAGKESYVFDSGQILKGLLAAFPFFPEIKETIIHGCEWLLSCMTEEGRLVTPATDEWGGDQNFCDEHVHLYCLEPLLEAGKIFHRDDFLEAEENIKQYYITRYKERILHFSMLSHFHAYVMEALVDIGEYELAKQAMEDVATYQKEDGSVPGLNNVAWICSTGLFQLAIVWYKLGNLKRGDRAFQYACSLQNPSGGWYGSYSDFKTLSWLAAHHSVKGIFGKHAQFYFEKEEISWAVKYFLDAIYYGDKCASSMKG